MRTTRVPREPGGTQLELRWAFMPLRDTRSSETCTVFRFLKAGAKDERFGEADVEKWQAECNVWSDPALSR
jgi:hypothetical protein